MKTIEICLTRHAESVSNAEGRWQGHGDSPLSARGELEVAALREALAGQEFDRVISSDLRRTLDTSAALDVAAEPDSEWREIDVGKWEGLTMPEVLERFPDEIAALRQRKQVSIGGGESWLDVFERAGRALATLRDQLEDGERAIVFTHGGVIAAILAGLLGAHDRWPWPMGRVHNTARTTLRFGSNGTELLTHNQTSSLLPQGVSSKIPLRDDQALIGIASESWDAVPFHCRGDQEPLAPPGALTLDALRELATAHAGTRRGLVATRDEIVSLANAVTRPERGAFAFDPPQPGSLTHLLVSAEGAVLLDYQVGGPSP